MITITDRLRIGSHLSLVQERQWQWQRRWRPCCRGFWCLVFAVSGSLGTPLVLFDKAMTNIKPMIVYYFNQRNPFVLYIIPFTHDHFLSLYSPSLLHARDLELQDDDVDDKNGLVLDRLCRGEGGLPLVKGSLGRLWEGRIWGLGGKRKCGLNRSKTGAHQNIRW